jgi:RNA polymerase sigma factor (sigma-70 family)
MTVNFSGLASDAPSPARDVPRRAYDLDLTKMDDEALVVLADECTYTPAVNALIERYHRWTNWLIATLGRSRGLTEIDIQDAQQEAVFAVREAIASYDTGRLGQPGACTFRTFLRLVLSARFSNYVKMQRRADRRFGRSLESPTTARTGIEPGPASPWGGEEPETAHANPAQAAESQELLARFHDALSRCEDADRRLWEGLTSGRGLRTVAGEMGISYDKAKRQRRSLLARLKGTLKEVAE